MILSDRTIRKCLSNGILAIVPEPGDAQIQPASVDLKLANEFLDPWTKARTVPGWFSLAPGQCVLATTLERVKIPPNMVARVEGKSSWGRQFLMVHSTAGFIDPGFDGQITLELKNLSDSEPLLLKAGCYIAQVSFQWLDEPADRPYGSTGLNSHYQGQTGVTPAVRELARP